MIRNKYDIFGQRFLALFIDGIILKMTASLFALVPTNNSSSLTVMVLIVVSSVPYVYTILMTGKYGQTIGKMVMKIKVVDHQTEGDVTFYQAFMREVIPLFLVCISIITYYILFSDVDLSNYKLSTLGYIILFLPAGMILIWPVLEIVTMLFDDKYRALHDKVADTVVVKMTEAPLHKVNDDRTI